MMDPDHLSPVGSHSPLASSNSDLAPRASEHFHGLQLRPPRACEYCRQHKVRCDIDPRDPSGPCGRCVKSNRDCVSGSHSRKRRKTTDSRVLDLERKVERLTARLEALEKGGVSTDASERAGLGHGQKPREDEHTAKVVAPTVAVHPPTQSGINDIKQDVIDRQIISVELAGRIFQHFVSEISHIFPIVVFPPNTVSSDIRRLKPTLFLAILVVASGPFDVSLQRKLHDELLKSFSDQIIYRGLKSVELIQSLIVSVLWHIPPENVGGNVFSQFINMAIVMATDLALTKSHLNKRWPLNPNFDTNAKVDQQWSESFPIAAGWRFMMWGVNPESSLPECRRAVLSCYFLSSNMAQLLRRSNQFPFTDYMADCVTFLETSDDPAILHSDRIFVQWIKIVRKAEEVVVALTHVTAAGGITEPRIQAILEDFLEGMAKLQQVRDKALITPALELFAQCIIRHIYDLILNPEHNVDELIRPQAFESFVARQPEAGAPKASEFHAKTVRACLTCAHSCLDRFLMFPLSFVVSLPAPFYIEIGYSVGLLLRMFIAASVSNPTTRILSVGQIKFGEYVENIIGFLDKVTEKNKRHGAERLRLIIGGLKGWVDRHRQRVAELSLQTNRVPVPPSEQQPTPASPPPPLDQTYLPSPHVDMGTGTSFASYADASRGQEGLNYEMQDIDFGDPMLWDSFQLTEFLRLDGAPPWG